MSRHIPSPKRTREFAVNGYRRDPHLKPINNKPLQSEDDAALQLLKLTFKEGQESDAGIVGTLQGGSAEEKLGALKALKQIACGTLRDGQALALRSAAPALLALIPGDDEQVAIATCEALVSLAAVESNADIMREAGILKALADLLSGGSKADSCGKKLQNASMQVLASLMLFSAENRQAAKELGMVQLFVDIMKDGGSGKAMRAEASSALHTLSFDENVPNEVVNLGGLNVVIDAMSGVTQDLSGVLVPGAPMPKARQMVISCLGIVANVTAVDGMCCKAVEAGVAEAMVAIVMVTAATNSTDFSLSALKILEDIAAEPDLQEGLLKSELMMKMLLGLLQPMETWNRKESTAQLASKAASIVCKLINQVTSRAHDMHNMGLMRPLIAMVRISAPQNISVGASGYATQATVLGCIESSLNALAAMCTIEASRHAAIEEELIRDLADLVSQENRYMRAAAARVLQEIVQSPAAQKQVSRHDAVIPLVNEIIDHMGGACQAHTSCLAEAVVALRHIAYNDGGAELLLKSKGILPLLAVLEHGETIMCRAEAAQALVSMACLPEVIPQIAENGALGAVRMLKEVKIMSQGKGIREMSQFVLQAVGLLRNLVSDPEDNDTISAVITAGALDVLVPLLGLRQENASSAKIVIQAASALNNLSISFHCEALCENTPCLQFITTFLTSSARQLSTVDDGEEWEEASEQVSTIVYNCSLHIQLRPKILMSGVVKPLVAILSWRPRRVQIIALICSTIANFVVDAELKTAIATEGAVQMLTDIIKDSTMSGAHAEACTALHNLAANSEDLKRDQLAAGAVPLLIGLCRTAKTNRAIYQKSSKALNMLANKNRERREFIIAAGGAEFLAPQQP